MDWWWQLLDAMDAHDGQAAWAQFAGAVIALVIALGLGVAQLTSARRAERLARRAYITGAVAAVEHAEVAMDEVQTRLGGFVDVARDQVAMSPAIHMLDAAEAALASLPLAAAPSEKVARALVTAQFQVRRVSGGLRAFLADAKNAGMRMTYDEEVRELLKAAVALRAEQQRFTGNRSLHR
jgi:hypothetical protein